MQVRVQSYLATAVKESWQSICYKSNYNFVVPLLLHLQVVNGLLHSLLTPILSIKILQNLLLPQNKFNLLVDHFLHSLHGCARQCINIVGRNQMLISVANFKVNLKKVRNSFLR